MIKPAFEVGGTRYFVDLALTLLDSHITLPEAYSLLREGYAKAALEKTIGRKGKAARMLGIHRNTLLRINGGK